MKQQSGFEEETHHRLSGLCDKKKSLSQEKSMNRKTLRTIALSSFALVTALVASSQAQDGKMPYPTMAPIDQYLMADRNAEIALARSAAPESISRDAEILVLGRHGFETAVKGKTGFVCLVERSWTAGIDENDPEFWNPKARSPICLNPPAARSFLPHTIKKTELALAGRSKAQMSDDLKAAFDAKELPAMEPGAMGYMMSKQQHLDDHQGHWHPHLMFFVPQTDASTWGANLQSSPVFGFKDTHEHLTIFFIPLSRWSDGTADTMDQQ
jgi:hypothetical protein